jgi:hypothetical protein
MANFLHMLRPLSAYDKQWRTVNFISGGSCLLQNYSHGRAGHLRKMNGIDAGRARRASHCRKTACAGPVLNGRCLPLLCLEHNSLDAALLRHQSSLSRHFQNHLSSASASIADISEDFK